MIACLQLHQPAAVSCCVIVNVVHGVFADVPAVVVMFGLRIVDHDDINDVQDWSLNTVAQRFSEGKGEPFATRYLEAPSAF